MIAHASRDNDFVTWPDIPRRKINLIRYPADPRGIDEDLVCAPSLNHFRVTRDDLNPCLLGCPSHGADDSLQINVREPFFEDIAGRQIERLRAGHAEVVDRAANGQFSYVTAAKKDGLDHIGIRGEGEPSILIGQHSSVIKQIEVGVGEIVFEQVADQFMGQAAASAMSKLDFLSFQNVCLQTDNKPRRPLRQTPCMDQQDFPEYRCDGRENSQEEK